MCSTTTPSYVPRNYRPGQNDVYVSLQQVKKNRLRKGDVVTGFIKAARREPAEPAEPAESAAQQQAPEVPALVKVEKVNGRPVDDNTERVDFGKLTPLYPQERLRLESGDAGAVGPRVIDLISPIGKGQRGLIVSPPKAGKTMILKSVAHAIKQNNPEVHLMMVLVDERPEEVTDMQRSVDGEVIASTFDRPADDHTTVAELAIERAKRLVELGKDVVILLDSMTRLGRAYNQSAPASGRILSGGVDAPRSTRPSGSSVLPATLRTAARSRFWPPPWWRPAPRWTRSSSKSSRAPAIWSCG